MLARPHLILRFILVDDPRASLLCKISGNPLDGYKQPFFEVDEEVNMDDGPKKPGSTTFQCPQAEVEHCGVSAYHSGVAPVFKNEWL